ncbi:MAG: RIP metalloprotease RseP [Rhodocyclales bacterium GT-UBC]|nr:MAG: RIP metalloprotease RseP [Rhodocyclales bacterium GT-UBC]
MSDIPFYLLSFLVVLGVLVVFHELGHYFAARLCGVKVLRFSIGFGPVVWQRRCGSDGTEWALSLLPLGGYVKMLDEREASVASEELHRAFNRQGVGRRSLIVAAGPLANFVLAIVLYWAVFLSGSEELLPVLATPPEDSPAAVAGIREGDRVLSLDGEAVATWGDFRWSLLQKAVEQDSVELEVVNEQREISRRRIELHAAGAQGWEGDALGRLGVAFYRPAIPAVIGTVVPGGAAERFGLQVGDRIVELEGQSIRTWRDFVIQIRDSADKELVVVVDRRGQEFSLNLIPDSVREGGRRVGKVGVGVADDPAMHKELKVFVRYGLFAAAGKALTETWDKSVFSLVMMGKMLTGEVSLKNLSGPVTIADYAGQSAKLGLDYYLKFMALVSISLGVLNLLPVPVLDGGHLMYHMVEVVRRRPLSERAMEIGQRIGLAFLALLMAFAFFNDITRLVVG